MTQLERMDYSNFPDEKTEASQIERFANKQLASRGAKYQTWFHLTSLT